MNLLEDEDFNRLAILRGARLGRRFEHRIHLISQEVVGSRFWSFRSCAAVVAVVLATAATTAAAPLSFHHAWQAQTVHQSGDGVTLPRVVRDYDAAIRFFVDVLQFELVEDAPSLTNDGRSKRWVVIRPAGGQTGILLARADGDPQTAMVGQQFAGRVGLFLRVDDFDATCQRMDTAGVRFVSPPRDEPYGRLAVFLDLEGNRWDLLGMAPRP